MGFTGERSPLLPALPVALVRLIRPEHQQNREKPCAGIRLRPDIMRPVSGYEPGSSSVLGRRLRASNLT